MFFDLRSGSARCQPSVFSCRVDGYEIIADVAYGSSNPAYRPVGQCRAEIEKLLLGSAIERLVRFVRTGGSRSHVTPPSAPRAERTQNVAACNRNEQALQGRQNYTKVLVRPVATYQYRNFDHIRGRDMQTTLIMPVFHAA